MMRRSLGFTFLLILLPRISAQGVGGVPTATLTNNPQHPFCTSVPYTQTPKMPIFHMDVKTGFLNGYRSNQSVIVEITAKYPEVWRIQQVFLQVPDNDPYVHRPGTTTSTMQPSKFVGHWAWNLLNSNTDPDVGGTQPVDCGGITSYGPFGMLASMGAHAAREIQKTEDPNNPHKGYAKMIGKWVPPSNWENIIYRKTITVQSFVTFEKIPPSVNPQPQVSFTGYNHQKPARWVKMEATLLNLDYIDVHNYLIMRFGPMYQQYFGAPQSATTVAPEL